MNHFRLLEFRRHLAAATGALMRGQFLFDHALTGLGGFPLLGNHRRRFAFRASHSHRRTLGDLAEFFLGLDVLEMRQGLVL
jgi:hypothetical protein